MLLDCRDSLLGELTSKNVMINNGWTVDVTDDNTNTDFDSCDKNTFFGYKDGDQVGQVSTIFRGTGRATLVFGNCWSTGYLSVYINGTEIGRAYGNTKASVRFSYSKGDALRIKEFNSAIIALYSFAIDGCGKFKYN